MRFTLIPVSRDTNDIGRNAFKINSVWFAANKPTMATYFIICVKRNKMWKSNDKQLIHRYKWGFLFRVPISALHELNERINNIYKHAFNQKKENQLKSNEKISAMQWQKGKKEKRGIKTTTTNNANQK